MTLLPAAPSVRPLILINAALALTCGIALFVPIKLAVSLRGAIVSDGPSTVMVAPHEGIVLEVPPEGASYSKGTSIFRLQQPVMQEDLQASRREVADLKQRLAESNAACKRSIAAAEGRLTEARAMDKLNTQAYTQQAISRLQLYQYRNSLFAAVRDLDDTQSRCRQEQSQYRGDLLSAQDRLGRAQIAQQFQNVLTAPDNGTVYGISVKPGQRVQAGQEIAKFSRSTDAIAELRLKSAERPFVQVGRTFQITSPTYAFMPVPPVRYCSADTITPDVLTPSGSFPAVDEQVYLLRCSFPERVTTGSYPFLIGMEIIGRTSGSDVSLFQLMLKGYRSTVMPSL